MATLTGQTVKGSYKDLLQVSNSNSGIDATARAVSDGEATASLLYLSTTEVYSPGKAGTSNTVFGKSAGASLDAGSNYNTFFGHEVSIATMDDATYNVGIGYRALYALEEGDYNVCVGRMSGGAITDGQQNTAYGNGSLESAVAQSFVVAIGSGAASALNNDTADGTVAVGRQALNALTSGAGNTAVGYQTLDANLVGSYNTAIGYESLTTFVADASNHGHNSAVGHKAGKFVSTGTENTFVGSSAGQGITGTPLTGNDNTAIGAGAGIELEGAAHSNTFVGASAGNSTETGIGNTLMGYEADVDVDSDSYQVRIGHYGALRYMTAQLDMSGDKQGSFTNAGTDNRPATGALLKIPQYGFLKRVTCTVVTASGGTGIYNISLGNTSVAAGTVLDTQLELIGVGAADGNGTTSRTQAADTASDTNLDIVTAKYVHIWEASQATDASAGWADVDKFLYVCHAGTGNAENAQDAVIRITAEFFGED